jgi:hypothetical protein
MSAVDVFGPKMSAILVAVAIGYFLLSFTPVLWPAYLAYRRRSWLPRPILFVLTVAALVYGVLSFIGFALLLPIQVYGIFVAPSLEMSGLPSGAGLLAVSGFLASYWWLIVPPVYVVITWLVASQVGQRWQHICAAPPNNSFKPNPLHGSA